MSTPESTAIASWLRWKRAFEQVRAGIVGHVTAHTELSEAELSVLIVLRDGGGAARQSEIAASLGWDRTRLSHLLTRMETRDLLARRRRDRAVEVHTLPRGREMIDALIPILDEASHEHLVDRLSPAQRAALDAALIALLRE